MPWKRMAVDDQRMQFVIRAMSGKERLAGLCREFGISRPTGYLWRKRYLETRSLCDLVEHSRRPQRSPRRTATDKEQRVVEARQETGWGAKKLRVVLRDEEQLVLPVRTIHRILARHELVRGDVHAAAPQRFARSVPNELWQMDTKGKYQLADGQCHALCIEDDHSRYAVGVYALPVLSMEQAHPCIVNTFRTCGLPEAMLMDHGPLWWASSNGWGLTWLSLRLIEQGIRLLYGRVAHPQTQGKVERLHRTLGEAMQHRGMPRRFAAWPAAVAEFQSSYNNRRPHEAIGLRRPRELYQPSPRRYQEQPKPWEYPEGSDVRRVNVNGAIAEGGRKWFVCEALAGQLVRVERFDGKLLVSHRHMYIREINLERGTTQATVVARSAPAAEPAPVALRATSAGSAEQKSNKRRTAKV
jgi:transposase InsO family protein